MSDEENDNDCAIDHKEPRRSPCAFAHTVFPAHSRNYLSSQEYKCLWDLRSLREERFPARARREAPLETAGL